MSTSQFSGTVLTVGAITLIKKYGIHLWKESNEHDKYAVAIAFDDCFLKNVVGHVPLYWSKLAFKFLQFQNHSIRVAVTGKRVNRGAGLGLEIPVDYFFYGDSRVIAWLKNSIEKLDRCIDEKVGKCVK